mgnify:CR=1 FL=1
MAMSLPNQFDKKNERDCLGCTFFLVFFFLNIDANNICT